MEKKCDDEFEKNFLRAVDRALAVNNKEQNYLLQPVYDIPMKVDDYDLTERAISSFDHDNFFTDTEQKNGQIDGEHRIDGGESPNVELFDRTGELLENENLHWQSSAVYDHHPTIENYDQDKYLQNNSIENHVWSVVDDLTQKKKTQDLLFDEPQVSTINN